MQPSLSSLALLLAALAPAAMANDGVYLAQNGLVVIEMESTVAPVGWTETTAVSGYTGAAYLACLQNNFVTPNPATTFGFNFEITTAGSYWINVRNRHDFPLPTEENDVWVSMDGSPFIKVFSNGPQSVGGWSWEFRYENPPLFTYPQLSYFLSAGVHRIEFSARSSGFWMDRLNIALIGASDQYNETLPESPCRVGTMYGNQNNNSTGVPGLIEAWGTNVALDNNLRLESYQLPQGAIGFFIVSDGQIFFANPGGSSGNVLVGPSIGRYAGNVLVANAQGRVAMNTDLTQLPRPNGPVAVVAGQTWNFQFWHRDTNNGQTTSNFSRGLTVTFD